MKQGQCIDAMFLQVVVLGSMTAGDGRGGGGGGSGDAKWAVMYARGGMHAGRFPYKPG